MSLLRERTTDFAIRAVKLYRFLREKKHETVLSKQCLRSATSIGANVREAWNAQGTKDFALKLNIALKEANETQYWLELLYHGGIMTDAQFNSIYPEACEIAKLLNASLKTVRRKIESEKSIKKPNS